MVLIEGFQRVVKHGGCYRISIPHLLRKALNIHIGDFLHIFVEGDRIVIEKVSPDFTERKIKI